MATLMDLDELMACADRMTPRGLVHFAQMLQCLLAGDPTEARIGTLERQADHPTLAAALRRVRARLLSEP